MSSYFYDFIISAKVGHAGKLTVMDGGPATTLISLFLGSNTVSVGIANLIILSWKRAVINWNTILIFLICSILN
jgi:hypothetical protein